MEHPTPDHTSWTWVLERPCDNCGFDAAATDHEDFGALIRSNAAIWRRLLGRGDLVSTRPPTEPGAAPIWSALEYGCHVRDVYRRFHERVTRMLSEDRPMFADWDQNQEAVDQRYHEQDAGRVGYDLAVIAGELADIVDRVRGEQWDRGGTRSDGYPFTVETLVQYLLHDVTHHVSDVERGYEALE